MDENSPVRSLLTAIATPVFLGTAPIFGKMAINDGVDPFTVAAIRTLIAVAILWLMYILLFRRYIYIYPAGLMGCMVIGIINGIGSLFYYNGLGELDASVVQLINGLYLVFAVAISRVGGQRADRRTLIRVLVAVLALVLITGFSGGSISLVGVGYMLGSALLFAGTLVLSQYVLYEMPARTATLYILTTMGIVVSMVWVAAHDPLSADALQEAFPPILALGITTAFSRLAMFVGVKLLGGMQTAFLAIGEIAVALLLGFLILGDKLTSIQWLGVTLLLSVLFMIRTKDLLPHGFNPNLLIVANMSSVQFQRIAFHRAFGTYEHDNEMRTMMELTTQELQAIRNMMGADLGAVDPFPIGKLKKLTNDAESRPEG